MTPILYTTVGVSDFGRSLKFYEAVFGALSIPRSPDLADGWAGWGPDYDNGVSFWICPPFDGKPPTAGNGTMIALRARNEAEVDAFHAAAAANGGTSEGSPGTRALYGPSFYVAYVRDPDGNKLACAWHRYDATKRHSD
ncbi:MAG: VOC family protein [Parvibaculaceae bacterium]